MRWYQDISVRFKIIIRKPGHWKTLYVLVVVINVYLLLTFAHITGVLFYLYYNINTFEYDIVVRYSDESTG